MSTEQVTIAIEGMSCSHCQKAVNQLIHEVEGVTDATVSLENSRALVTFDTDKVSKQRLVDAINSSEMYHAS